MDDSQNNNNTLIGLALLFGIGLLAWFFADLLDSKAGERAAAFGAVVGGIIGAGGAVFAVFLTQAKAMLAALQIKAGTASVNTIGTPIPLITPKNIEPVVDSLITALQLAKPIIMDDDTKLSPFELLIREIALREIEADIFI